MTRAEGTVINAIDQQARILANKNLPREQRVEALKFVIHFVGDVHQPLHCVDRDGDKGGNGQLVFYREQKKATDLHRVWDTLRDRCSGRRYTIMARTTNHHVHDGRGSLMQVSAQDIRTAEGYRVKLDGAIGFRVFAEDSEVIVYPI